jgi:tetratricopeptide (TPR) repeat protein
VTLALYARVTGYEFNNYDDAQYVTKNPWVLSGLKTQNFGWAFSSGYAGNWHPLTWFSHMLDIQLYGLRAGGHHLTNLLFHIANSLLLLALLRRLTGSLWRSAFVAALFAWHPAHVESVAWVAERKDVLSTFFWVLTVWAYVRHVESSSTRLLSSRFYILALLFFALGLMSKPMLVSTPILLLLLDFWPLNRFANVRLQAGSNAAVASRNIEKRKVTDLLIEKIPFVLLAAISSYVTFRVQANAGAMSLQVALGTRVANAIVSYVRYIAMLVWPHNLAVLYPYRLDIPVSQVLAAVALLIAVTLWAGWSFRKRPYLLVGWLWFIVTLLPVIGLVQVGEQALADRYTYFPALGVFLLVTWQVAEIIEHQPKYKPALAGLGGAALIACLGLTWAQISSWKNSITLFTRAVEVTRDNSIAHCNLGEALAAQGNYDAAMTHFNEALRVKPRYLQALNNKGALLCTLGKPDDAISFFNQALAIRPHWSEARRNLGLALQDQGKADEALRAFRAAVADNPADDESLTSLAAALVRKGERKEAAELYRRAINLAPNAYAENGLGDLLELEGNRQEAFAHFVAAINIKPDFAEAHNNVGNALVSQGQLNEAAQHFAEAARLQTNNMEAHFNLGNIFAQAGQADDALREYNEVLRIKPEFAAAHLQVARLLGDKGDTARAIKHCREALKTNPPKELEEKIQKCLQQLETGGAKVPKSGN